MHQPLRSAPPRSRRLVAAIVALLIPAAAHAATCGNTAAGFEAWKAEFAQTARAEGIGDRGLRALAEARYSQGTINADRNQTGVRYSFEDFVRIRLGSLDGFAAQAKRRIAQYPDFYAALERVYGVPASILVAIHGMETGWGRTMGSVPVVSSILTVAYDCRRADFFRRHALAALQMVDRGMLSPDRLGAFHGELGHTQFLPGNALRYGVDADGDGRVDFYGLADSLASTANFLRAKGWQPGAGYREGEPNFAVLDEWNAATVYQRAIAAAAARMDGL